MKVLLRLLKFSKPYHHYFPEYLVYIIGYTIFSLLNFSLIIPLLDFLFKDNPAPKVVIKPVFNFSIDYLISSFNYYSTKIQLGANEKVSLLLYVTIVLVLVTILKNVFSYLSTRTMTRFRVNLVRNIRNALFSALSYSPISSIQKRKKGQILSVLSNDVSEIENSMAQAISVLSKDPLMILSTFGALFYISNELTLFTLIIFPISGIVINYISKQLRRHSANSQSLLGSLLSFSEEMITGNKTIKVFNAESFVFKRFNDLNQEYSSVMKKIIVKRDMASPISEILGVLVISIIIVYGGSLILNQESELSPSAFIGYLGLYFSIISPAKNVGNAIANLQKGIISSNRVLEILEEKDTLTEKEEAIRKHNFEQKLEFKNVSFCYSNEAKVLSNINFTIQKGRSFALVGESGAGKSTIADLIPRFYDVTEGQILIDNQDIRDLKKEDLRRMISMVTQESILFNDSIYKNITFGLDNVPMQQVIDAAKIANAHPFIEEMEEGYHTHIGDRGSRLSGGQKQRITIARAILKNAPIIILDEATSALDIESEKLVQEALIRMLKDKTSIIIAHRMSTIQHANTILVVQNGKIVESGNHQDLISNNSIYKRLVDLQSIQ